MVVYTLCTRFHLSLGLIFSIIPVKMLPLVYLSEFLGTAPAGMIDLKINFFTESSPDSCTHHLVSLSPLSESNELGSRLEASYSSSYIEHSG